MATEYKKGKANVVLHDTDHVSHKRVHELSSHKWKTLGGARNFETGFILQRFETKRGRNTVKSLLSDYPWCRKKCCLRKVIALEKNQDKEIKTEKQNGYLQSGRLRA